MEYPGTTSGGPLFYLWWRTCFACFLAFLSGSMFKPKAEMYRFCWYSLKISDVFWTGTQWQRGTINWSLVSQHKLIDPSITSKRECTCWFHQQKIAAPFALGWVTAPAAWSPWPNLQDTSPSANMLHMYQVATQPLTLYWSMHSCQTNCLEFQEPMNPVSTGHRYMWILGRKD